MGQEALFTIVDLLPFSFHVPPSNRLIHLGWAVKEKEMVKNLSPTPVLMVSENRCHHGSKRSWGTAQSGGRESITVSNVTNWQFASEYNCSGWSLLCVPIIPWNMETVFHLEFGCSLLPQVTKHGKSTMSLNVGMGLSRRTDLTSQIWVWREAAPVYTVEMYRTPPNQVVSRLL